MSLSSIYLRDLLARPARGPDEGQLLPQHYVDRWPYREPAPLPWIVRTDPLTLLILFILAAVIGGVVLGALL